VSGSAAVASAVLSLADQNATCPNHGVQPILLAIGSDHGFVAHDVVERDAAWRV